MAVARCITATGFLAGLALGLAAVTDIDTARPCTCFVSWASRRTATTEADSDSTTEGRLKPSNRPTQPLMIEGHPMAQRLALLRHCLR